MTRDEFQFGPRIASWRRSYASRARASFCLALLVGCGPAEPDAVRNVEIVISGDTEGWIVPCGCTSNQSGGLLRRATILDELRAKGDVVYLDAGGAASGLTEYDRAKFAAIVEGEVAMGVAAHNIGASEARFAPDELRRWVRAWNLPLVSCNVRDEAGNLIAEPMRIIDLPQLRIAVTGVLSESLGATGITIDTPHSALLKTLATYRNAYDVLIVLAYMPQDELMALAQALPEADLVIGGPTGQSVSPQRIGPTWMASATNKGKFLARFTGNLGADRSFAWTGQIIEVDKQFEDSPRQLQNIDKFRRNLAALDLSATETSFAPSMPADLPASYQIAGTVSCRDCHANDCDQWEESAHQRAWQSLVESGSHVDAYCQQCHTTGFGFPGGFVSVRRSDARTAVGCESCHGPSQGHVLNPRVQTGFAFQARSQCTQCHDRDNSPEFDYDTYWAKIEHGESPLPDTSAATSIK